MLTNIKSLAMRDQQKSTPRDLTWSAKEHSKRLNDGQQKRTASDLMLVSIKEHKKRLNHANVGQQTSTKRDLTWSTKEHKKRLNIVGILRALQARVVMLVNKRAQQETECWSAKEHSKRLNVGQQKSTFSFLLCSFVDQHYNSCLQCS